MRKEFEVHRLNADGMAKAHRIAHAFEALLAEVEKETGLAPDSRGDGAREMALVRTDLERACFYAK
jgi:hypothetical protein